MYVLFYIMNNAAKLVKEHLHRRQIKLGDLSHNDRAGDLGIFKSFHDKMCLFYCKLLIFPLALFNFIAICMLNLRGEIE